ncbi:hypothetical protein [Adhaeribacter terreus]|uniref:Uncharacterized protein n=1 Tax=Adhaeribacter terreus TaxID=529703 RepID=A0ABW0E8R0_9BACT
MKTLLLALTFMLSITLSHADEGDKKRKHSNVPKGKITYSEHKSKRTVSKKRIPKKSMFAGEGMHKSKRLR